MSEAENDAAWVAKLIITERDATITALRQEVERLKRAYNDLVALERKAGENIAIGTEIELAGKDAELIALRQRVVEVVGPFAELVPAAFPPVWGGDEQIVLRTHLKGDAASLRIDDFRAARALINEIKETTDGR